MPSWHDNATVIVCTEEQAKNVLTLMLKNISEVSTKFEGNLSGRKEKLKFDFDKLASIDDLYDELIEHYPDYPTLALDPDTDIYCSNSEWEDDWYFDFGFRKTGNYYVITFTFSTASSMCSFRKCFIADLIESFFKRLPRDRYAVADAHRLDNHDEIYAELGNDEAEDGLYVSGPWDDIEEPDCFFYANDEPLSRDEFEKYLDSVCPEDPSDDDPMGIAIWHVADYVKEWD